MPDLSEDERKQILENTPPKGTWALMLMVGIGMVVAWLFLYFGVFMPRGVVD